MIRNAELTDRSVVIDGTDVSHQLVGYTLEVRVGAAPRLLLDALPFQLVYAGQVDVDGVPLDGIARLRARLDQ